MFQLCIFPIFIDTPEMWRFIGVEASEFAGAGLGPLKYFFDALFDELVSWVGLELLLPQFLLPTHRRIHSLTNLRQ